MTLGETLRTQRLRLNLTQQQVADKVHITRPLYNYIEQNKCLPNLRCFKLLADTLKISVATLYKSSCIHPKIACIHAGGVKTGVTIYKFCVRLNRNEFSLLTFENLKKCGMKCYKDFMRMAYEQFCNQLKIIEIGGTSA